LPLPSGKTVGDVLMSSGRSQAVPAIDAGIESEAPAGLDATGKVSVRVALPLEVVWREVAALISKPG
ncbi:MAG TPA: hypothetical protein VLM89_17030, partial [Phycisphaerae bacterium]|nr:hypothetical protein [Phycisphaerae bacterium]